MKIFLTIDLEDWFQVDNLRNSIQRKKWDSYDSRVERNTDKILNALTEKGNKATFFILGWIAERYPNVIKKIANMGHEVACHGYCHDLIYKMNIDEFREDVKKTKFIIEDITGKKIIGYRAPSFSITDWAIDVLIELGFKYDSSLVTFRGHDRYGSINSISIPDVPYFEIKDNFFEIKIPCLKIGPINLPWGGGGYFRLIPYFLFKAGVKFILRKNSSYLLYIHPWEFDPEQPRIKNLKFQYRFRHYINIDKTEKRFRKLLNEFHFEPIETLFSD